MNAPVALMDLVPSDKARALDVPVWPVYQVIWQNNSSFSELSILEVELLSHHQDICNKAEDREVPMENVERFAFYRRAKVW